MTGSQAAAPPSAQRTTSPRTGLRQASLAILILLAAQFSLGMGVNLYVASPTAGHPRHGSWFINGPLFALHASLGMLLILSAVIVLVTGIRARNPAQMVTLVAGLVAILLAAFFGSGFADKLTSGTPLAWRWPPRPRWPATPVGLYASTGRGWSS